MKKIVPVILFVATLTACNNAADNTEMKDSTNVDVNTRNNMSADTSSDTSSYERMPNKTTDSLHR